MARPGKSIAKQLEGRVADKYLPVDGWVRKLRAVEDYRQFPSSVARTASIWNELKQTASSSHQVEFA